MIFKSYYFLKFVYLKHHWSSTQNIYKSESLLFLSEKNWQLIG